MVLGAQEATAGAEEDAGRVLEEEVRLKDLRASGAWVSWGGAAVCGECGGSCGEIRRGGSCGVNDGRTAAPSLVSLLPSPAASTLGQPAFRLPRICSSERRPKCVNCRRLDCRAFVPFFTENEEENVDMRPSTFVHAGYVARGGRGATRRDPGRGV